MNFSKRSFGAVEPRHEFPNRYLGLLFGAMLISGQAARGDTVTFTGNLSSDGSAVGSGDPVIANPATINIGDPFSILLNYNAGSFTQSGSSYVLTDASATLEFDGYSFDYTSAAGKYIEFSTPGVFGLGTASFLFCSSLAGCSTDDFINLYFAGTITDLGTLASQASGLTEDTSASPSEFEFFRNFSDGSQTDLQGTLTTPTAGSAVPEPSTMGMMGLIAFVGVGLRALRAGVRSR